MVEGAGDATAAAPEGAAEAEAIASGATGAGKAAGESTAAGVAEVSEDPESVTALDQTSAVADSAVSAAWSGAA